MESLFLFNSSLLLKRLTIQSFNICIRLWKKNIGLILRVRKIHCALVNQTIKLRTARAATQLVTEEILEISTIFHHKKITRRKNPPGALSRVNGTSFRPNRYSRENMRLWQITRRAQENSNKASCRNPLILFRLVFVYYSIWESSSRCRKKSASDIVGGFRVIQFAAVADANWKYAQREVWSAHSVYSIVCLLCVYVCISQRWEMHRCTIFAKRPHIEQEFSFCVNLLTRRLCFVLRTI